VTTWHAPHERRAGGPSTAASAARVGCG
jgi:hypothetical protein